MPTAMCWWLGPGRPGWQRHWQQREAATDELSGFGYLAKSIFEDELRSSRDAEVRRRLERILAGLD